MITRRPHLLSVAILLLGAMFSPVAADSLLLEIENFDGPWKRQTNIPGFRGEGFCVSNANPDIASSVMRHSVSITTPGRHFVWVRGYQSPGWNRGFRVEVDGKLLGITQDGTPARWIWQKAGEVDLQAGSVEIVVHDADIGFECADSVLVTDRQDDDPMAEERLWWIYPDGPPATADALRWNIDACLKLTQHRTDPRSRAQWKADREQHATALRRSLGLDPPPEKTPLAAQVVGRATRDGYTIENLIFQSRPGFYVTANVYVPDGVQEPMPAVIVAAGHAMREAKNYPDYRTAQLALVQQGFLVLAYDPIGQGERRKPGYSHSVGFAATLVGATNAGYMAWDTVRAVDYLIERGDVDPKRIGLTGQSGGGLNTMYTMPIEPRVAAGASICFVCSYEAWIRDGGSHCICNHLPGALADLEEFEIIALNEPRPLLVGNGGDDPIFPIAGTRDTMRRAGAIYDLCDVGDRLALLVEPGPHGWSPPLREATYGWMGRWLQGQGDGSPLAEPPIALDDWNAPDYLALDGGPFPDDEKTYADLIHEEAGRLIDAYPPVPADSSDLRRRLWDVLGGRPAQRDVTATTLGLFRWEDASVERLAIRVEADLDVPALLLRPDGPTQAAVIFLDDSGKAAVRNSPVVRELLAEGVAVLTLDPRATGEVSVAMNHCATDAIMLGRPLLAQQASDVLAAAAWLGSQEDIDPGRVAVYARGDVGLIATLAGALDDEQLLATVATVGSPTSYLDTIADPLPAPLWAYAPNVLKVADIPQWSAMIGPRPFLAVETDGERDRVLKFLQAALLVGYPE